MEIATSILFITYPIVQLQKAVSEQFHGSQQQRMLSVLYITAGFVTSAEPDLRLIISQHKKGSHFHECYLHFHL